MLQCLLNSCTNLTQLDLTSEQLTDEGLNVLLQHGPNITDVRLGWLDLTRSRAGSVAKWQRLWMNATNGLLADLAYLPLRSVQDLGTGGDHDGTLYLPLTPSSQLASLLQQAVSNVKTCPAWRKQPATRILLYTHHYDSNAPISAHQAAQLFSALSPLAAPHLQHPGISIRADFGQQEVQLLAGSLGLGSNLRSLSLRREVIKPSFWPALRQHMPRLNELGLMHQVEVSSMGITAYLCTAAQPCTLYIGPGVLADHIVADLTDSVGVWQLHSAGVPS
jgi:hypothetical protein